MKRWWKTIHGFWEDESGQTAVEYLLIIAIIVGVIFALGGQFKTRFKNLVDSVFGQIEKKVRNLDSM